MEILFKDDVTVILLPGVSFMGTGQVVFEEEAAFKGFTIKCRIRVSSQIQTVTHVTDKNLGKTTLHCSNSSSMAKTLRVSPINDLLISRTYRLTVPLVRFCWTISLIY